jgi:NAD(P)H dehydrogenase (quinone)
MSIAVTGATGHLGGLVIEHLLKKNVPAGEIVAVVRNVEKASGLAAKGIQVRYGDYNDLNSLAKAFEGASKLLFVPSPDAHDESLRLLQHANVAKAAKDAKISHIAYYGYAFGEESTLSLAPTHLITENIIRTTGIPYTFLRNSLYAEVFITPEGLGAAVQYGALTANAGQGGVNAAARSDLAQAGAVVLTEEGHGNKTYNLTSDTAWTFTGLAQAISEASGKEIAYHPVSFEEYKGILQQAGLPEGAAAMVAGIYQAVADGETSKTSSDLIGLTGRVTPLQELVKQALKRQ